MIRSIILIIAVLFAIVVVSGTLYTKFFGPIGAPAAATSSPTSANGNEQSRKF